VASQCCGPRNLVGPSRNSTAAATKRRGRASRRSWPRTALTPRPPVSTRLRPVIGWHAKLKNLAWEFEEAVLCCNLDLERVSLLNDLKAIAHAVRQLQPGETIEINAGGAPADRSAAAGHRARRDLDACSSEGGHADFGPANHTQAGRWAFLTERFARRPTNGSAPAPASRTMCARAILRRKAPPSPPPSGRARLHTADRRCRLA
jgi:glucokinase